MPLKTNNNPMHLSLGNDLRSDIEETLRVFMLVAQKEKISNHDTVNIIHNVLLYLVASTQLASMQTDAMMYKLIHNVRPELAERFLVDKDQSLRALTFCDNVKSWLLDYLITRLEQIPKFSPEELIELQKGVAEALANHKKDGPVG